MSEPVRICEYNSAWKNLFEKEKEILLESIEQHILKIVHIGSTAIEGLCAKPIIDIMIGLESLEKAQKCIPLLEKLGFEYVPEYEKEMPFRRYFRKPPQGEGPRTVHIHMVEITSNFWKKQLYFRDFLRQNSDAKMEYDELKRNLAQKYKNNRVAYTNAKTDFILKILKTSNEKLIS